MAYKQQTYILSIVAFLGLYSLGFSQKTNIYEPENALFGEVLRLVEDGKYLSAQQKIERLQQEHVPAENNESILIETYTSYYYAFCAYQLGQPNTEQLYLTFIQNHPESVLTHRAYMDLGTYYFDRKKTSDAIEWYEKIGEDHLNNEEIIKYSFNLGYAYFKKKKFAEAKPLFRDIKNVPNVYYEPANYYYGFISYYQNDLKEARESFVRIQDSKLYQKVVPYYLAQILYIQEKYEEVIAYAEPLIQDQKLSNRKEIKHLIGQSYFELGDFETAIPYLQEYIEQTSKVTKEELYQLAYAQYQIQQYEDAIQHLLELNIVKDSLGQHAMFILGDCYIQTQQISKARDAFLQAKNNHFDAFMTEVSFFHYGKLSFELEDFDVAISTLTDFIEVYPASSYHTEASTLLGNALLHTRNYAKAVEILGDIEIKSPSIEKVYQKVTYYRGIELYNDQRIEEAHVLVNKSLDHPVDESFLVKALFLKGNILYVQKEYEASIQHFLRFKQYTNDAMHDQEHWISDALADYYIAYNYFKRNQYADASTYFSMAIQGFKNKTDKTSVRFLSDSYLRNADCLFMIKSYSDAILAYDQIIDHEWQGIEYAFIQKSTIYGLMNDVHKKIASLRLLLTSYPESIYADDAQFDIADAYFEQGNITSSIDEWKKFTQTYPNSKLMPKAFLKLGLSQFNVGKKEEALSAYKQVVIHYPNSPEVKEALIALEELYVQLGRPNDYIQFVENHAGVSLEVSEKDSLWFETAKNQYLEGHCVESIQTLTDYINTFEYGAHWLDAHYYRADCFFQSKDYQQAYTDYKMVISLGQSPRYEKSLLKATYIAYEIEQHYQEALFLYEDLLEVASSEKNQQIALIGLLRSNYKLSKHQDVLQQASQVLALSGIDDAIRTETHYYKAKSELATLKYAEAKQSFEYVISQAVISSIKVESAYQIAWIEYIEGQYQSSLDRCFAIKSDYASYEYWIVKTFILMADNYVKLENLFQAKATLQSIIDNYTGDQALIDEAHAKLQEVIEIESAHSKVDIESAPSDTIEFEEHE